MRNITTLFILFLFLASCTNNNTNNANTKATDSVKTVAVKPAVIKAAKPKFNYKNLYGNCWIPVSVHWDSTTEILVSSGMHLITVFQNEGDTGLKSFLPDTAEYKKYYEEFVDFRKDGQCNDMEGDIGTTNYFKIDSANNILTTSAFPFNRSYSKNSKDIDVTVKYLGSKYMLLQLGNNVYFYVNAAKMPKWRYVGGG